jgi:xylulose-5-phosphate/fructose-6-phosphate phosphoketolase
MSPIDDHLITQIDAYWCASNYLSVGQLYLLDNPLLRELAMTQFHLRPFKPNYKVLRPRHDLYSRSGHGGPALVAQACLEGSYSAVYPDFSQDAEGMQRLFKNFSFPGGIRSHMAPEGSRFNP